MKRKNQRSLPTVLLLLALTVTLCLTVLASCGSGEVLEYTLNSDGQSYSVYVPVSKYDEVKSIIVIPSTYNGKPVTRIGKDAFSGI